MNSVIRSTGAYLPTRYVKNEDFSQWPDDFRALIQEKTGIVGRHIAGDDEAASDLAAQAGLNALDKVAFDPEDLEIILCATSSPDQLIPQTAAFIQEKLRAKNAAALDINAVCSGFVYGLSIGDALVRSGKYRNVLLVSVDTYSKFLDWDDISTAAYFGDGAGAVLLEESEEKGRGILDTLLGADGTGASLIQIPGGGSRKPYQKVDSSKKEQCFRMKGKKIFDFAVDVGTKMILEILSRNSLEVDDISRIIPHQANVNIVNELSRKTSIPLERFVVDLEQVGNTASASIPIALDRV
ncbi:unnamed protein product, partial [marine sediment metagenome]